MIHRPDAARGCQLVNPLDRKATLGSRESPVWSKDSLRWVSTNVRGSVMHGFPGSSDLPADGLVEMRLIRQHEARAGHQGQPALGQRLLSDAHGTGSIRRHGYAVRNIRTVNENSLISPMVTTLCIHPAADRQPGEGEPIPPPLAEAPERCGNSGSCAGSTDQTVEMPAGSSQATRRGMATA